MKIYEKRGTQVFGLHKRTSNMHGYKEGAKVEHAKETTGVKYSNYDLTKLEIDICKDNFNFFDRERRGFVHRYKLKFLLRNSGYLVDEKKIEKIYEYLDSENVIEQMDFHAFLLAVSCFKDLEITEEENTDNEYIDAFVAMGGNQDKTGTISKNTLFFILKEEFELTIDMEEFFQSIQGEDEDIDFNEFCELLDEGSRKSGKSLTRVSSFASIRSLSRCLSFYNHL